MLKCINLCTPTFCIVLEAKASTIMFSIYEDYNDSEVHKISNNEKRYNIYKIYNYDEIYYSMPTP